MKFFIKNLVKLSYKFAGVYSLKHKFQQNLLKILCYHRFLNSTSSSTISRKYITQDIFARQINYLKSHFSIKPLEYCISYRDQFGKFPLNTMALTVDDGYEDFYLYAYPVLKHYGLSATVYLIYDFIEKQRWLWQDIIKYSLRKSHFRKKDIGYAYGEINTSNHDRLISTQLKIYNILVAAPISERHQMLSELIEKLEVELPAVPPIEFAPLNWDQIKLMSENGISFGSHTFSHEVLTTVSVEQMEYEIKDSKSYIEKKIKLPVNTFCYPHGKLNDVVAETVIRSGYQGAVTGVGVNTQEADRVRLRRLYAVRQSQSAFIHGIYQV